MGNKQNTQPQVQESIINESQIYNSQSQVKPKFTLDMSRKTQLTFHSDFSNPAKINVSLNGFTFWSNYDSGNLSYVEQVNESTFNLSIANDCQGRDPSILSNKGTRCWFNFKIVSDTDAKADFIIVNIATRFKKIWTNDSDIYVKINKQWSRYPAVYQGFQVKFSFEFKSLEIVQFAFVPPWSYKKNQKYFDLYPSLLHPKIYFRRDVIAKSLDGRNIELITITENGESEKQQFYCPEYLFPERKEHDPLLKFKKPYIFITCRVHAGEVPASYILKGILETFKEYTHSASKLLQRFVFIIIPMLNPDGVFRGHYRLDSLGYDQNRVYNRLVKYPKFNGPLAVLETCKNYDVRFYIDLHAHSILTNSFILTNWNPDPQVHEAILEFPRRMKQRVHHFRLKEALSTQINYDKTQSEIEGIYTETEENMKNAPEVKIHPQKENFVSSNPQNDCPFANNPYLTGVAKSDVYLTTSILFSYTLETNYRYYIQNKQVRKYQLSDFENLGKEIIESLNDLLKEQSKFKVFMQQQIFN